MRIANGLTQMRLLFTEAEYKKISDNGRLNVVYVSLDPREHDHFIRISEQEIPHSHRVAFSRSLGTLVYPDLLTLTPVRFPNIPDTRWGPEEVKLDRDISYSATGGWKATKPAMERSPAKGRTGWKKGQPPKVKKKVAATPHVGVAAPPQIVAATMSLKQAIQVVNDHKTELGDDLVLEITGEGRLRALMELGS